MLICAQMAIRSARIISARAFSASIPTSTATKQFDQACHLIPNDSLVASSGAEEGSIAGKFSCMLTDIYSINGVPNGGYIAAIAVKAAKMTLRTPEDMAHFPDCLSLTGPFHAATKHMEVADITTQLLHKGRSVASVGVHVHQAEQLKASFNVLLGNLQQMSGIQVQEHGAPDLPPREHCVDASAILQKAFRGTFKLVDEVQILVPPLDPFNTSTLQHKSEPGTQCSISGYMRFRDGQSADLQFFSDVAPPPTLNHTMTSWVPTLEYSVHTFGRVGGAAAGGGDMAGTGAGGAGAGGAGAGVSSWVRFVFRSPIVCQGLVSTDGELWSDESEPRLLARSRQLARHLLPRKK